MLQPETALALLAFLATLVGIRGNTWDSSKKGWHRVTLTGWIAALAAFLVVVLQVSVAIKAYVDAERREATQQSLRQLTLREMASIAEELRQRFLFLPTAIHHRYLKEAHLPESSSYDVIVMGEAAGYGRWGFLLSTVAREDLERTVRLSAITSNGQPLPDDLKLFMAQWSDQLDKALERSKDDLTDKEVLAVRVILEHEFIALLNKSLNDTKTMEAFSSANLTSLLKDHNQSYVAYHSFIAAVAELQTLGQASTSH
jgi:hypothetical protein